MKISTDMPLPTPRSVMSSPSHMMTPVPAVIVRIMQTTGKMLLSYTRPGQPVNSRSFTATVTKAVELKCRRHRGDRRSIERPKIPDVCDAIGVRCIRLVDFVEEQGWIFR